VVEWREVLDSMLRSDLCDWRLDLKWVDLRLERCCSLMELVMVEAMSKISWVLVKAATAKTALMAPEVVLMEVKAWSVLVMVSRTCPFGALHAAAVDTRAHPRPMMHYSPA
jgi:hypothetical protein